MDQFSLISLDAMARAEAEHWEDLERLRSDARNSPTECEVPNPPCGHDVESLPISVASLYGEARRCVQYTAYTAASLVLCKLLMNVSVDLGADGDKPFAYYVGFLDSHHYIPPNARQWVDALRRYGNEATHEIEPMEREDAQLLLDFAEMLLRIVYEFPAKVNARHHDAEHETGDVMGGKMLHLYEFEVFEDGGWFLAVPYDWEGGTQGETFEEACEMAADWLRVMCEDCAMNDKEFPVPTFGNDPRNGGRVVLLGIEAGLDTVREAAAVS